MKSSSFKRNNESVFRVLQEEPKAKKKVNKDRIVYFVVFGCGVLFLLYALLSNYFYIEANGHILFEKVKVQIPEDIRVDQFHFEEGDSVSKGDTLFFYHNKQSGFVTQSLNSISNNSSSNWKRKEILSTQKTIALNQIEIEEFESLIAKHELNLKQLKKEVALDLIPKSKLEYFKRQIDENQIDFQKTKKENNYLRKYLGQILSLPEKTDNNSYLGGYNDNSTRQAYRSPLGGTITRIHKKPFEVALKSEAVMTIHKNENIYIKGFFEQADMKHLKVGDIVNVQFPDGTESEGRIGKFHFATYALSPEFQKKYEPLQRTLGVDVYPLNDSELHNWRVFYKLGVKISKAKYW